MVVERELAQKPAARRAASWGARSSWRRSGSGRTQSGGTIIDQLKRLGASCDWDRECLHHVGGNFHDAVIKVFVDLYNKGLIYRGKRLVNWDPHFETAISDLEVENLEVPGHMWHFKYPLAGGETYRVCREGRRGQRDPARDARLHLDRHDPARNDAGRRRGGGSSIGRALCANRRQALRNSGGAEGAPPPDPDHHRRIPRPRLRLGRGEDHRRA